MFCVLCDRIVERLIFCFLELIMVCVIEGSVVAVFIIYSSLGCVRGLCSFGFGLFRRFFFIDIL